MGRTERSTSEPRRFTLVRWPNAFYPEQRHWQVMDEGAKLAPSAARTAEIVEVVEVTDV